MHNYYSASDRQLLGTGSHLVYDVSTSMKVNSLGRVSSANAKEKRI